VWLPGRADGTRPVQNRLGDVILHGDPEWPTQLDDLGDGRPLLLCVRGSADRPKISYFEPADDYRI
jgi:hypothetical protein